MNDFQMNVNPLSYPFTNNPTFSLPLTTLPSNQYFAAHQYTQMDPVGLNSQGPAEFGFTHNYVSPI